MAQTYDALEAFLRNAIARDDLVAVAVPGEEMQGLTDLLERRPLGVDPLTVYSKLVLVHAETWMPGGPSDHETIHSLLEVLASRATEEGRPGLSVVERIGAVCAERGDVPLCEHVERDIHEGRGAARILCPYNVPSISEEGLRAAHDLPRSHTSAVATMGAGGRIERLGPSEIRLRSKIRAVPTS